MHWDVSSYAHQSDYYQEWTADETDNIKPVIANAKISETANSYKLSCKATDNYGVTRVEFTYWDSFKRKIVKKDGIKKGSTYYCKIAKPTNSIFAVGYFSASITAWDFAGNKRNKRMDSICVSKMLSIRP